MTEQLYLAELTTKIVTAVVGNNSLPPGEVPGLIAQIHGALAAAASPSAEPEKQAPAVTVRKSVTPDYIICLEDGARLKMLKRYLRTRFDMTPEAYRRKWDLPADYPMTAPNYSKARSDLAREIGPGKRAPVKRKPRAAAAASVAETVARTRKPGRKPRAEKTRTR